MHSGFRQGLSDLENPNELLSDEIGKGTHFVFNVVLDTLIGFYPGGTPRITALLIADVLPFIFGCKAMLYSPLFFATYLYQLYSSFDSSIVLLGP